MLAYYMCTYHLAVNRKHWDATAAFAITRLKTYKAWLRRRCDVYEFENAGPPHPAPASTIDTDLHDTHARSWFRPHSGPICSAGRSTAPPRHRSGRACAGDRQGQGNGRLGCGSA